MPYNYSNYGNSASNPYQWYQDFRPNYLQQPQVQQSQAQQNTGGIIWVQGEAGAKAYPVAPGNSVLLMDSENAVLYVKSTDTTGRPLPMEIYDLVKRVDVAPVQVVNQQLLTKDDLLQYVKESELESKVKELIKKELGG